MLITRYVRPGVVCPRQHCGGTLIAKDLDTNEYLCVACSRRWSGPPPTPATDPDVRAVQARRGIQKPLPSLTN